MFDAYNNFKSHMGKWRDFLACSTETSSERGEGNSDEAGEYVKKDRQLKVVNEVLMGAVCNPKMLQDFISPEDAKMGSTGDCKNIHWIQDRLDAHQQEAVAKALNTDTLCFIQGPPGTGKTTVITEICLQLLRINPTMRILVCSETHVAVDNLIEKFHKLKEKGVVKGLNCFRAYTKSKSENKAIQEASLDWHLNDYFSNLQKSCIGDNIADSLAEIFSYHMNDLTKELMLNADIVGVTCNSLAKNNFSANESFDYLIFDEVCKATLPEILIPLSICKRAILVGDPKQLPPVFLQEDQEIMERVDALELEKYMYIDTLFDRLPLGKKKFLGNQYRMTNEIGDVISKHFYDSKLKNGRNESIPNSILWCDYVPTRQWGDEEGSPYNMDEVEIVMQLLDGLKEKGHQEIAIISPYKAQKRRLKEAIREENYSNLSIDIDTIDSFQGKDADVVLFCITRSMGSLYFFSNPRRMNVALSRAKNLCCIIGYSQFAIQNKTLDNIYNAIPHKFFSLNDRNIGLGKSDENTNKIRQEKHCSDKSRKRNKYNR